MESIKELRTTFSYVNDIETLYGKQNGIFFIVAPLERKNMICMTVSVSDAETHIDEIQSLRNQYDAIPMGGVYMEGISLNIEFNLINLDSKEQFEQMVNAVTHVLASGNVMNISSQNGSFEDVGIFRVGTKVLILDGSAFEGQKEAQTSYKKRTDNIVMAWLAAIAGMLGGVAIWVLINQIGFIAGIAGYFIIHWGIKLFRQFGGTLSRKDVYIMFGLSVVMILFAEVLSVTIDVWRAYNSIWSISFIDAFKDVISWIVEDPEMKKSFLVNVAIGLGLSVWSSWGLIQSALNFTSAGGEKRVRRRNNRLM